VARPRFSKSQRLQRKGEFKRVFDTGQRGRGRYLTLLVAPNNSDRVRLGIVASRKLGDAVRRNRAKRLIREVFRHSPPPERLKGLDVVVIPRRELFDAVYSSLENDFQTVLRRCADRLVPPVRS
jgi:ribonuclease P protein component